MTGSPVHRLICSEVDEIYTNERCGNSPRTPVSHSSVLSPCVISFQSLPVLKIKILNCSIKALFLCVTGKASAPLELNGRSGVIKT